MIIMHLLQVCIPIRPSSRWYLFFFIFFCVLILCPIQCVWPITWTFTSFRGANSTIIVIFFFFRFRVWIFTLCTLIQTLGFDCSGAGELELSFTLSCLLLIYLANWTHGCLRFCSFSFSSAFLKIGATEGAMAAATVSHLLMYLDSLTFKALNGFT